MVPSFAELMFMMYMISWGFCSIQKNLIQPSSHRTLFVTSAHLATSVLEMKDIKMVRRNSKFLGMFLLLLTVPLREGFLRPFFHAGKHLSDFLEMSDGFMSML